MGWDKNAASGKKRASREEATESNFVPIALRLDDDPLEIKTRFQIIEDILKRSRAQFIQAPSLGTTYLSRIVSMLYLLDYATYYTSIFKHVDPDSHSFDRLFEKRAKDPPEFPLANRVKQN